MPGHTDQLQKDKAQGGVVMSSGIIEIDLKGMRTEEAKEAIDQQLSRMSGSDYRLRVFHGLDKGINIRDMIYDEYTYGQHPRIIRVEHGWNGGITELVLKDY